MATNLLDLAQSALGSGALGKIAGSLGENEDRTKTAVDLAGSAILGSLIKKVSSPQGSEDVFKQVSQVDSGLLDNIGQMISGTASEENTSAMSSLGIKLISSLLGGKQDSVISMIAKMAGIGEGSSKSILSMIAPLLLGTLAKQVKSGGLDMGGLTKMILGQKKQVAQTLPSNFSQQLGIANLLDEGTDAVREGANQVSRAAAETADAGGNLMKVLVPLAIVAGLGFLVWKMTSSGAVDEVADKTAAVAGAVVDETKEAAGAVADGAAEVVDRVAVNKPAIPGVDMDAVTKELGASFGSLTDSITGITDEATARTAVPQINALTKQMGQFGLDKMPEAATKTLSGVLQPLIQKLQAAIELASKIPGVKAILEPAIGPLMDAVAAYSPAK